MLVKDQDNVHGARAVVFESAKHIQSLLTSISGENKCVGAEACRSNSRE